MVEFNVELVRVVLVRVFFPDRLVVSNAEDSPMRKSSADAQSERSMRVADRLCFIDRPKTTASGDMADVRRRRKAEGRYCPPTLKGLITCRRHVIIVSLSGNERRPETDSTRPM